MVIREKVLIFSCFDIFRLLCYHKGAPKHFNKVGLESSTDGNRFQDRFTNERLYNTSLCSLSLTVRRFLAISGCIG